MRRKWLLLFALLAAAPLGAQVRVWQGVLEIPVYEEGAPDPNPAFDQYASTRFNYPYTLRTNISDRRVVHKLRAVYLENEYLKCSVLPDIGGHVYTCLDKISGQPMFYANPSIKKALIGYRGAWAAFGVEFNFPVSHNWMSMSPVDFALSSRADGSASVTVGNVDRVYGMEWMVELTLRPGSTVLEQRVTLSNRSDFRHRFYWWSNAGVQIWDDTRIEYPMQFAASHGFTEVQPWPVDSSGRDLSIVRNQTTGPVSVFVHGSREDFMGIWHPHTNTGTAHYSRYDELPAKKIWSWGVDADGLDWRKALSDNESAYAELQGGLFRNQETYSFLEPRQQIHFTEYWMPVRELGGISRANLAGVVHLERKDGQLAVALNVNQRIAAASIRILDGQTTFSTDTLNLSPETTWRKEIALSSGDHKFAFELRDAKGTLLLAQTEGQYDWTPSSQIKVGPQQTYQFPEDKLKSEDDWLQTAKALELDGDPLSAVASYQKALQKFPSSYELLKAAGRLDAAQLRFAEAAPLLSAAAARNTTDAEVSYYLGITHDALGEQRAAITSYEEALRSPEFRAAAALRLAELQSRAGNLSAAEQLLTASVQAAPNDLRASEELLAIQAASGNSEPASRKASELLQLHPSDIFLRELSGDSDLAHLAADPYRVLRIATQYAALGLYRQAIAVLAHTYPVVDPDQAEPGMTLPQDNPLVVYLRGYCRQQLGESPAADFAQASKLSTLYVFPSTLVEKLALDAAVRLNPDDASAHALLGTWYFARAKTADALSEWNAARRLNPLLPALDASLGQALLHETGDYGATSASFGEGIGNDPRNVANYTGAVDALTLLGSPPAERVAALQRYPDLKQMPDSLVEELALNEAEAGDFTRALALFNGRFFGREEGGTNVRQVWIEVRLIQSASLAQASDCRAALDVADHLGAPVLDLAFTRDGLESYLKSARTRFLLGEIYEHCGKSDRATELFSAAAKSDRELVWSWAASRKLPDFDSSAWKQRLVAAAEAEDKSVATSARFSGAFYRAGILNLAAGRPDRGRELLRAAIFSPDSNLSHHFARLALAGKFPQ